RPAAERRAGPARAGPRRALPSAAMAQEEVRAAGGLVVIDGKVAVVHRPRYDDWSLPKGKLEPGEGFEEAAVREIAEETGARARIVRELDSDRYTDNRGRPKLVRWYLMDVDDPGEFTPDDEVDELRWLAPERARDLVSYDHDRALLSTLG
ncbi:MAG: 8-oxo-dGTP diphosphatase, partial [Solirubrobacteraceae bacterium]|nr:8-oxo-dGTP diphosphatase [Solirubrobacteraceae bacterium]